METIDYSRLYEFFNRYGSYPTFDIETETQNMNFAGTAMQHQMYGPTTIKVNVTFQSPGGFNQFVKDITYFEDMAEESYLRRHNPALQRAWEEYQIILKLTR